MTRILSLFIATLLSLSAPAQVANYVFSEPVDIPPTASITLLQLENGNTLLFQLENRKGIVVKVFDKEHKLIATKKHLCDILDINQLDRSSIDGITQINGEAVMFVTQQVDNRETMIRIRINGNTGGLIAEEKLIQSASFNKRTVAHFLQMANNSDYSIVCETKIPGKKLIEVSVKKFDSKHALVKEIPLKLDYEAYDDLVLKGPRIDEKGNILLNACVIKYIQKPHISENTVMLYYLPADVEVFLSNKIRLSDYSNQYSLSFTRNEFAQNLNLMLTLGSNRSLKRGNRYDIIYNQAHNLIIGSDDLSSLSLIELNKEKLNKYVTTHLDTSFEFNGSLHSMRTNKYGLTTCIYTGSAQPKHIEHGTVLTKAVRDNICIVQYDDKGAEISANYIPYFKERSVTDKESGQLLGFYTINTKNDTYILLNDLDRNYNKDITAICDSMFEYDNSHAIAHKLNKKKELTKFYLFGTPAADEYNQIIAAGHDYDITNNRLAILIRNKKGKVATNKIAWVDL